MRKIYLLSELFYPNKTSTAYIMTEIAKSLAIKNDVTVICSDIVYDSNYDVGDEAIDLKNVKLLRTKSSNVNKNKPSSRLKGSLVTALAFGNNVVKNVKSNDIVFAVTNPFLLVLTLAIIRVFKKFEYILLVHDVFPENAVSAGMANQHGLLYKISKTIYDWSYAKADRLVVLGRDMKEVVEQKISNKKPVIVVENWFDEDLIYIPELDKNNYLKKNIDNKIIIGFAGNIGRVQNLHRFIEIFAKCKNNNLELVIVGGGALLNEVNGIVQQNSLENVLLLGPKPRSEQSEFLNCFDIGLITLSPGMFGLGVPSKTYNLISLGKPILFIGDKNSEVDQMISGNELGSSFDWTEEDKILEYLNNLKKPSIELVRHVQDFAKMNYSNARILSKMEKVIVNEN